MLQRKSLLEEDVVRFKGLDGSSDGGGGDSSEKERSVRRLEVAEEAPPAMEADPPGEARQGRRPESLRSGTERGGFSAATVEERLYGNGRHGFGQHRVPSITDKKEEEVEEEERKTCLNFFSEQ